jgi:hypothetical protein
MCYKSMDLWSRIAKLQKFPVSFYLDALAIQARWKKRLVETRFDPCCPEESTQTIGASERGMCHFCEVTFTRLHDTGIVKAVKNGETVTNFMDDDVTQFRELATLIQLVIPLSIGIHIMAYP